MMGKPDNGVEDDDVSTSSSSSEEEDDLNIKDDGNDNSNNQRERKRSSKKQKKKRKRHDHSSRKKRKKHRSSRHDDSASDESSEASSSSSKSQSDDEEHSKKRRKKSSKRHKKDTHRSSRREKKSSKKRHEPRSRRQSDDDSDSGSNDNTNKSTSADAALFGRNYALANALLQLLDSHPALVTDLPIMLIRLAGGTTFDLSQMTDPTASHGIAAVFQCLEPYGVQQQEGKTGAWMWKGPQQQGGNSSNSAKNDLVLVQVVRAMLDQIGMTNDAVESFENEESRRHQQQQQEAALAKARATQTKAAATSSSAPSGSGQKDDPIIGQVKEMFSNFDKNEGLAKELGVLCNMILEGESVALDGLPDERLRQALEGLFAGCGLEKCEMENDSDGDDDDETEKQANSDGAKEQETPSMGYGLPENENGNPKETTARVRLESILMACQKHTQSTSSNGARRRVLGPSLPPAGFEQEEESDEEGPQLTADATALPETDDAVRAQAARRALELRAVNAGLSVKDVAAIDAGRGREEWMIIPGQYDFLDCIKSAPIRNRTFQGGSKHDKDKQHQPEGPIDPAVQAEMDAILLAHQESRGPSLFEEHRAAKAAAEAEKKKSGKNNWKWNRDRDLDEGRRVDTDALNMVMGGAATGLQSKFQGGFGR